MSRALSNLKDRKAQDKFMVLQKFILKKLSFSEDMNPSIINYYLKWVRHQDKLTNIEECNKDVHNETFMFTIYFHFIQIAKYEAAIDNRWSKLQAA